MKKKGVFISLEGIDGSGKTSLMEALSSKLDKNEVIKLREPGGTYISEKIRKMLLDAANKGMMAKTEALLYAAARSQVVEEIIRPALAEGKIVLADRYMDSTIAYQGYGRGLDINFLQELNYLCTEGLKPQLTLLLDIDPLEGQRRRKKDIPDRLEKEGISFQHKVRDGYLRIACSEAERIKVLDAGQNLNIVAAKARDYIEAIIQVKV